jgi:hypothetical protein
MRTDAIADSIGLLMLTAVTAMPFSCSPSPAPAPLPAASLQPLVATAGVFGVLEAAENAGPTPPAPQVGCAAGCRCNGTGVEKSGEGLSDVACRCPDNCSCKAKKNAPAVTNARPGWPPKNTVH